MSKFFAKLKDIDIKTCLGIIAFLGAFMLIFCAVFWSACAVQYAKADISWLEANTVYFVDTSNTWYNPSSDQTFYAPGYVYISPDGSMPTSSTTFVAFTRVVMLNGQGIRFTNSAGIYQQYINGVPTYTPTGGSTETYSASSKIYIKYTEIPNDLGFLQPIRSYLSVPVLPAGPTIDMNSYAVVPLDSIYWSQTAPATFGLVGAEVTNADSYRMGDAINPYTVRMSVTYRHNTLDYDHTQIVLLANVGVTGSMKYYFIPFDEHYSDLTRIDIFFADDTLPAPVTQITSSSFFSVAGDNYTYMNYLISHSDLYQDGVQFAVDIAYAQGFDAGYTEQNNLISVMWESFSLPVRLLFGEWQVDSETGVGRYVGGLFNFTVLGVDIRAFVLAILTILILVSIVKFILGLRR